MDVSQMVAENLKRLRMERNLSLGQLSALCDVSKVMLSQIEKAETNPTINTLWKIANGLKVSYTALLELNPQKTAVVRKSEISPQADEAGQYRLFCYYPTTPHRDFELFQIEMDAHCSHTTIGHSEKSQEYVMVLEGELTFTVDEQTCVLKKDDAIQFIASGKHTYYNSGETPLKAIIINYYPV